MRRRQVEVLRAIYVDAEKDVVDLAGADVAPPRCVESAHILFQYELTHCDVGQVVEMVSDGKGGGIGR